MAGILPYAAASWEPVTAAGATLLVALAAAILVDRLLRSTERRLAAREGSIALDASGRTRLRFLRRLTWTLILGTGVFLALLQFDSFDRVASAALASGAVVSAIIGFAARDTLGNMVAGATIAVTQPLRVGDHIDVAGVAGIVEDVTLTFTWVRTGDGGRVILPNQLITTNPVRNDSLRERQVTPAATVWIAPGADERAALEALAGLGEARSASIAEATPEAIALRVTGAAVPAAARDATEAALRADALAALRRAGVARAGSDA